ncbi:MAG: hypothetical protein DCC49_02960 [Acidobacteria bacterium]|nr:MAG: hypothetical protein DCC49_02960 [Acidobacteriota bacterium]
MQCSKCNTENRAGATFCDACGAAIDYTCKECGAAVKPHSKFCDRCGAQLSGETEVSGEQGISGEPASLSVATALPPVPSLEIESIESQGSTNRVEPAQETPAASRELPSSFGGGRYQVVAFVGEGAKKLVYRARDTRLDRDVAISLIKSEGMNSHDLARLKREAQAMAWLGDHPNVVTIYDLGEENDQIFIVSQFMDGGDVAAALDAAPDERLAPDRALEITAQIATALEHAHEKGIIHRDIKPENVWLSSDGTAKLGDFGMAMVSTRTRITAAGMMIGTVSYMAPEIVLGNSREADARCDIYSLGAMLYEMLTGLPPFEGDMDTVIKAHLNVAPEPPSKKAPGISAEIDSLVLWMLAKAPNDRPRSAQMLLQSIAAIRAGSTSLGPATVAAAIEGTPFAEEELPEPAVSPTRATSVMLLPEIPTSPPALGEAASEPVAEQAETEAVPEESVDVPVEPVPALEEGSAPAGLADSIIGRELELDDLTWVLDEALAGRGRFVRVRGAQGVGRSRLVSEIASCSAGKDARVFVAACREEDRPEPFHYWMPLVGLLVDEYEVSKLRTDLGDDARNLAGLIAGGPRREKLLEAADGELPDEILDPESLVPGLTRMIRRLAASTPFVAVLDDAEWADGYSLRLLEELAHGASIISMMLMITTEEDPASSRARGELDRLDSVEAKKDVHLGPLDQSATNLLCASVFGNVPREPLATGIFDATGGVPLDVLAAARVLNAEGALDGVALPEEWQAKVPLTLEDSIARQCKTFSDEALAVIGKAAILGEEFNLVFLGALSGIREPELREVLQAPVFAGLINPDDSEFSFSHKLLREAVLAFSTDAPEGADRLAWAKWQSTILRATRAAMAGEFEAAEDLAEQAHRIGSVAASDDVSGQVFGVQIYGIRKQQGRLADVEPALRAIAKGMAGDAKWRAAMVAVHLELGRHADARDELASLASDGFSAVPDDPNRLAVLAALAQAAVQLRDGDRCRELLDLLLPYRGEVALLDAGAHCDGAIDREIGLLADALSQDDEAVSCLESAVVINDSLGAEVLAANVRRELAVALIHRDSAGDSKRAVELLREAEATFAAIGLDDLAIQAAAVAAVTESKPLEGGAGQSEATEESGASEGGLDELVESLKKDPPDLKGDVGADGALTLVAISGASDEIASRVVAGRVIARQPRALLAVYGDAPAALGEASTLVGAGASDSSPSSCAAVHAVSDTSASGDLLLQQVNLIASLAATCSPGEIVASAAAHELGGDSGSSIEERFVELKGFPGSHRVFVTHA